MILYILTIILFALVVILSFFNAKHKMEITRLEVKHDNTQDMIIHISQIITELEGRIEGVEDYVKMIKSETENEKHSDYWASVMNYNPYLKKETDK